MTYSALAAKKLLRSYANKEKARILQRFFKTGPGEYGFGDRFLGVVVPDMRMVAKKVFNQISAGEISKLVFSPYHEERLLGLLVQVMRFERADDIQRKTIYAWFLKNTKRINNWDLVDLTAPNIVGAYLYGRNTKPLYELARSRNLWERRIAIVATHFFIRQRSFDDTCAIVTILLKDKHDLIHKACGWMLREVGKREQRVLEAYLQKHASSMPRTMLRYAIERFCEAKRRHYLRSY